MYTIEGKMYLHVMCTNSELHTEMVASVKVQSV